MITPEKIEAWISEALERPESAAQIIQEISNRLAELIRQNEALRTENIALQSGARTEEYDRHIAHLEYQLDLVRRQLGGELPAVAEVENALAEKAPPILLSLLVYDSAGRIFHTHIQPAGLSDGLSIATLVGEMSGEDDPLRLLVVPATEELLFWFTSGRVATLPVERIPSIQLGSGSSPVETWENTSTPHEPNAGERLACLAPLSRMALAKYFVQTSRKGCIKKIRTAMGESILSNQYIGSGIRQPPDQPFELNLCNDGDRLVLVTHEGFLQCLAVDDLPPAIEDGLRLELNDYIVGAFIPTPGFAVAAMTQVGKAIHWTEDRLATARSFRTRGQALYSSSRREQGVRVVGAGSVTEDDWAVALDHTGQLRLHTASTILQTGAIPVEDTLVAFTFFSPPNAVKNEVNPG